MLAASTRLRFGGIHAHIGSQVFRLDSYAEAAGVVARFADDCERATGVEIPLVNLGGGLGARYLASDPDPSVAEYAAALRNGLGDRQLMVEPGRSIAAAAARDPLSRRHGQGDPGRPDLCRGRRRDERQPPAGAVRRRATRPTSRVPVPPPRPLAASVAGKHCEQGDVIVPDAHLPAGVAVGDLLVTPVTGAYGYSMASNYNKVPRPAVVFLRDGAARIVVRRETPDDLVRLDA